MVIDPGDGITQTGVIMNCPMCGTQFVEPHPEHVPMSAAEMREQAAKYLRSCAETFKDQGAHPCGRAFQAAADQVAALPIDPPAREKD